MEQSNYERYMETNAFKSITQCYSLSTVAVWIVRGENPNVDMAGSQHQPILGYYAGKLEDVIRYAVDLPDFWQYGRGGDFFKYEPPVIVKIDEDSIKTRQELLNEKEALRARLQALEARLGIVT